MEMQPVIRRIYRLALAVTLAAGMTIGLGACNNRQEVPANTQEENTQDEQTAAVPDNATQQETSASPSAPQGEPSSSSSQQPVDTNSDERNVRDAVTRMLDAIKNPSREGMETYLLHKSFSASSLPMVLPPSEVYLRIVTMAVRRIIVGLSETRSPSRKLILQPFWVLAT